MRKLFTIIIYTVIVLLIGRNLTILPRFQSIPLTGITTDQKLENQIKRIVSVSKGNYAVYFVDLKNKKNSFGINEHVAYTAFSLNKVPIVASLYYLAGKKEIDLEEKITLQEEDIQDYGTGTLRYEEPGTVYSLKTLANLALSKSDNTAVYIIANKIGHEKIQELISGWGLTQTDIANNKTSLTDMYILFNKIYSGEIVDKKTGREILDFLKNTEFEDRLPVYLPKEVSVYHKTGDGVGSIHDLGIIEGKNFIYFLGVLTTDVGDREEETKKIIGQISKKTYEFVANENN